MAARSLEGDFFRPDYDRAMRRIRFDRQLVAQLSAVVAATVLAIAAAARLHQWNSDDVALQVAMRTWTPSNGTLWLPEATWILKVPLYAVAEPLLGSRSSTLLIEALILNVISALLVWWMMRVLLRTVATRAAVPISATTTGWLAALVTIWLITLSSVVTNTLVLPTNRNIEVGLIAVGVVLTLRRIPQAAAEPFWSALRQLALPATWWGVLAIDDPAAMYAIVLPCALAALVVLAMRRSATAINVLALAVGSMVVWRVGLGLLHLLGVRATSLNPRVIYPSELPTTLGNAVESLGIVFDVRVFGAVPKDLRLAVVVPQALLLLLGVVAFVKYRSSLRPITLVLGCAVWASGLLASYVLSAHGLNMANIRYIVFAATPLGALLAAAMVISEPRLRRTMVALLAIVVAVHVSDSVRSLRVDASPNAEAARLVDALSTAGITRGYGDFWETLGPSYFNESLTLVPVTCVEGQTAFRRSFVNDAIAKTEPGLDRTAYIHNSRPGLTACSLEQVEAQFGEPSETIAVSDNITLLVYEGDLGESLAPSPPPG